MQDPSTLVIGTRGSPLALAQARETAARLAAALGWDGAQLPLKVIRTTGDAIQDRPLSEAGGKGLFTKELDIALIEGTIDLAVHSAKDLPTLMPEGLAVAGYLPREDARDALISRLSPTIAGLPRGASFGSASLRREAMMRRLRPDLQVVLLRGNVGTRLDRVEQGEIGVTLLAMAGLKRLGLEHRAAAALNPDVFLPAVGQGAIAVVTRERDARVREAVDRITDRDTGVALVAERAFLAALDGSCRTPIAGHATVEAGAVVFRGMVLRPDGSEALEAGSRGAASSAEALGREAAQSLLARMPASFFHW